MDLELKIISATDLQKSNLFSSKLQPYVVASISGATSKTPVDNDGDRNPNWNHPLTFSVPIGQSDDLILRFQIRSRRSIAADKLVGEVCVPLRDLIKSAASGGKTPALANFVSYQVRKPSGRPKGVLTFSYRFNGKISGAVAAEEPTMNYPMKPQPTCPVYPPSAPIDLYPPPPKPEPVMGYPAVDVYPPLAASPAMQTSYGYPAQGGYGYGYPTQTGYGYPHQAGYGYGSSGSGYGYGYGGQMMQPSRKKSGGLGLGAGLLGGALAGLVIGDLVSDVGFD